MAITNDPTSTATPIVPAKLLPRSSVIVFNATYYVVNKDEKRERDKKKTIISRSFTISLIFLCHVLSFFLYLVVLNLVVEGIAVG